MHDQHSPDQAGDTGAIDEIDDIDDIKISVVVNGVRYVRRVEPRMLLADFLRHTLCLTGTHVGCEHGVCGACTIIVDGSSARSCLMLAVQADGCELRTVEGLGSMDKLSPLQQAFQDCHALQCGFCTPGMLMTCTDMLEKYPLANDEEIREGLSGNICRCTGYVNIVEAVRRVRDASQEKPQ
ncbi:MAG: (2Fe-2S)-binding protein [Paucimonas sp.]|nr:(2Fe-2S)-binding protein [Paucimonas sp.]